MSSPEQPESQVADQWAAELVAQWQAVQQSAQSDRQDPAIQQMLENEKQAGMAGSADSASLDLVEDRLTEAQESVGEYWQDHVPADQQPLILTLLRSQEHTDLADFLEKSHLTT